MKKVLVFGLTLVMLFSMCITAFAAPGSFVSSPSGNKAPELVEGINESEECEAQLVITPYSERDTLPEDVREKLVQAYNEIVNTLDLSKLNAELAKIAEDMGIDVEDLAVSDLFDISYYDCDTHDDHGYFSIKLKQDTLKNFVCLLHLNGDKWEIVEGAKVSEDGTVLSFKIDDFSPFAIIVNTGADGAPQTGDNSNIYLWVMLFAGSAFVAVVVFLYLKKKRNEN